jgi:type III secretory pathway component EscT
MDLAGTLETILRTEVSAALVVFGLLVVRWTVFLYVAPIPVLGEAGPSVRAAVAAVLAVASIPAALPADPAVLEAGTAAGLAVKEALVGIVLGAVFGFVLAAFETAGRLADTYRGASMADLLVGGDRDDPSSPLGVFAVLAALALLSVSGGFLVLVGGLMRSVDGFPVASFPLEFRHPESLASGALALFSRAWEAGFLLAVPALAASLLVDVSLGLAARVSPGFGGYFLALPLRAVLVLGGLVVGLALLRPFAAELVARALALLGA